MIINLIDYRNVTRTPIYDFDSFVSEMTLAPTNVIRECVDISYSN